MKKRTQIILGILHVVAWLAFVGLIIKAGAILISYTVSTWNPEGAKNLYNGWNLYNLKQYDFGHYTATALMMVVVLLLQAYVAYLIVRVLSKIKIANPFSSEVSNVLERVSYFILLIWVAALLYDGHVNWLEKRIPDLQKNLISLDFLFFAGIVFVFAQIFKKGVELQSENELTV